jgi:hypothetical protein
VFSYERTSNKFAVKVDHGCSPHWKVRVGATRSDVYVSNRSTGSIFHGSLHENPDHWLIKGQSRSSGDSQEVWLRWIGSLSLRRASFGPWI